MDGAYLTVALIGVAVLLNSASYANGPPRATEEVLHYLEPERYGNKVPAWVVAELKARGCKIPQASYFDPKPHNLIRGQLVTPGQLDWAALCSRKNKSSIMLISKRDGSCSDEVGVAEDNTYIQQVATQQRGFSRIIRTAKRGEILRYVKRAESESPLAPSQIAHEGIMDQFMDKGSSVLYCKDGRWLELLGSD